MVNSKLNFAAQGQNVASRAFRVVNFTYLLFKSRGTPFLLKPYFACVVPIFDVSVDNGLVYCSSSIRSIKLLASVQSAFVRRLPQFRGSNRSYLQILADLCLDALEMGLIKLDLIEAYRIIYGFRDVNSLDFFTFKTNSRMRADGFRSALGFCHTDVRTHLFAVRAARYWNVLPFSAVMATSLSQFKQYLDKPKITTTLARFVRCFSSAPGSP